MGIAREDKEGRQDWVMRGFRQFDAPVCVIITYDRVLSDSDDTALSVARLSRDVVQLAQRLTEIGNPHAVADATVAALMAQAAVRASRLNVIANMKDVSNEKLRKRWVNEANRIDKEVNELVEGLVEQVETKLTQPPPKRRRRARS